MGCGRQYPDRPMAGVGVLVRDGDRCLLVKRAVEPDAGLWSIPGGLVEIGERAAEAAVREAREETGLDIRVVGLLGVADRIVRDEARRVKYHFLIVDYLAEPVGGALRAASDAEEARWVKAGELPRYELTPTLVDVLKEAGLYPG